MPVSNFFEAMYMNTGEQRLIQDLVTEAIQLHGIDVWYLPRTLTNFDELFTEDDQSAYNAAYLVEMFVKNTDGMGGDGDLFTKFGLQIRDRMYLTVSRPAFEQHVGQDSSLTRPREGDLIWVPLNRKVFEILYVEHENAFYQGGALYQWDLTTELFEYNGETFNTGITEVDALPDGFKNDTTDQGTVDEDGDLLVDGDDLPILPVEYTPPSEPLTGAQNDYAETAANTFLVRDERDPYSDGGDH